LAVGTELMISTILIPKLQERFPERGLRINAAPSPCAVFPAIHPEVGDIEIYDDGDELTVVAGNFTHGHFSNYDEGLSAEEKASAISDEVLGFLRDLFADQIVLWGSHQGSGGWFKRGEYSEYKGDAQEYVWSGPLR
jgi:hypothetical protein